MRPVDLRAAAIPCRRLNAGEVLGKVLVLPYQPSVGFTRLASPYLIQGVREELLTSRPASANQAGAGRCASVQSSNTAPALRERGIQVGLDFLLRLGQGIQVGEVLDDNAAILLYGIDEGLETGLSGNALRHDSVFLGCLDNVT